MSYNNTSYFVIAKDGAIYLSRPDWRTFEVIGRSKSDSGQATAISSYINKHRNADGKVPSVVTHRA